MKRSERMRILQEALISRRGLTLGDATQLLAASESTVRRLFIALEDEGLAIRTHGGVRLAAVDPVTDYSFELLNHSRSAEKQAIASAALERVRGSDTIFLDGGTTVRTLALALARAPEATRRGITVFTNSYANVEVLTGLVQVVLTGGEYRPNRRDFCGYVAESVLSELHFTRAFVGADGIVVPESFMTTDFDTARLTQVVLRNTDDCIVLSDSDKFARRSLVAYARFDEVDTLITDDGLTRDVIERVGRSSVELVLAPTRTDGGVPDPLTMPAPPAAAES